MSTTSSTTLIHFAHTEQDPRRYTCAAGLATLISTDIHSADAQGAVDDTSVTIVFGGDNIDAPSTPLQTQWLEWLRGDEAGSRMPDSTAASLRVNGHRCVIGRRDAEKVRLLPGVEIPAPLDASSTAGDIRGALRTVSARSMTDEWPLYDTIVERVFNYRANENATMVEVNALAFAKAVLMVNSTFRAPLRPDDSEVAPGQMSGLIDAAISIGTRQSAAVEKHKQWARQFVDRLKLANPSKAWSSHKSSKASKSEASSRIRSVVRELLEESVHDSSKSEATVDILRVLQAWVGAAAGSMRSLLSKHGGLAVTVEGGDSEDDLWKVVCTSTAIAAHAGEVPIPDPKTNTVAWQPIKGMEDPRVWSESLSALYQHAVRHVAEHSGKPLDMTVGSNRVVYEWPQVLQLLTEAIQPSAPSAPVAERAGITTAANAHSASPIWLMRDGECTFPGQSPSHHLTVVTDSRAWVKQMETKLQTRWSYIPEIDDNSRSLSRRLLRSAPTLRTRPSSSVTRERGPVIGPEVVHLSTTDGKRRRARLLVWRPDIHDPHNVEYVLTSPSLIAKLLEAEIGDSVQVHEKKKPSYSSASKIEPSWEVPVKVEIGTIFAQLAPLPDDLLDLEEADTEDVETESDDDDELHRHAHQVISAFMREAQSKGVASVDGVTPCDDRRFQVNVVSPPPEIVLSAVNDMQTRVQSSKHLERILDTFHTEHEPTRQIFARIGYCTTPSDIAIGRALSLQRKDGVWDVTLAPKA